jgi:DNA-binding PadR family transcriptional regulator
MKSLNFQVLLALSEGERHGWALVRELQQRSTDERILPGNFYRTLRGMLAEGLIEEAPRRGAGVPATRKERRTYFRLTEAGRTAAKAEARKLESLVAQSRARKLLSARGR